jgi:cell wall-associated NlpC family hydrolase
MPMRELLLLLIAVLLFSHCSIFTQSYNYNNSRNDNERERNEPERRERPLYEAEEEEAPSPNPDDDVQGEEIEFEPTETEETTTNEGTVEEDLREAVPEDEAELRLQVLDYARQHLGTKYRYGGNTPKEGFDCSGFTKYVMDKVDVAITRTSRSQENEGKKIKTKNVKPGDLVFFRRSPVGKVFHVSIVVENSDEGLIVIHSTSRGVVIDNISKSSYWSPKLSSARDVLSQ